jgi:CheY-like chemotaxis protein
MDRIEPTERETILLAEDHDGVRRVCSTVLFRHGYRVLEAKDGNHAMEIAESHKGPIQLLLSDVTMPELDGPGLAHQLRRLRPDVRVIFMSAESNELDELFDGCPFVQKPFRLSALLETIRTALAKPPNPLHRKPPERSKISAARKAFNNTPLRIREAPVPFGSYLDGPG